MVAMGFLGGRPSEEAEWVVVAGSPVPASWQEEVVSRSVHAGVSVTANRRGFVCFDFEGWRPGRVGAGGARTMREWSEVARPVLIQRLRLMNAHLTLVHAAAAHRSGENAPVRRVRESDVYTPEMTDEGERYWLCPRLGPYPEREVQEWEVRTRQGFELPKSTLETALDWLDVALVNGDLLIPLDLMNQAQVAATGHDYALAVVAGWTVCELQIRAFARSVGSSAKGTADDVAQKLEGRGHLTAQEATKLASVRRKRNKWLHKGVEPAADDASGAIAIAAEQLERALPNFTIRTGAPRWVLL